MLVFHVTQFARNGYFVQLLISSTLGVLVLQVLAARAPGADDAAGAWVRAGAAGMWTVCTVEAGMIGYQRFQGTLVYLLRTPLAAWRVLLPLIGAASVFGLGAMPLAALAAALLGQDLSDVRPVSLVVAVAMFWLASVSMSLVIGTLFVLTPNAMTYEGLLAVPMVIFSGVFGLPDSTPAVLIAISRFIPTTIPVQALLSSVGLASSPSFPLSLLGLGVSLTWIGIAAWLSERVALIAVVDGNLDVV